MLYCLILTFSGFLAWLFQTVKTSMLKSPLVDIFLFFVFVFIGRLFIFAYRSEKTKNLNKYDSNCC